MYGEPPVAPGTTDPKESDSRARVGDDLSAAAQGTLLDIADAPQGLARSTITELDSATTLPDGAELPVNSQRYRFLKVLGEGGMGKVYLAHDNDLLRNVAIKVMTRTSLEYRTRFLDEAQVMGQLDHPNILTVHDLGSSEAGHVYYTMPVVRGRTLQSILESLKGGDADDVREYSLPRLVQILLKVIHGIAYAHAEGVIHRDLKPENVMVGTEGEVRVLDWGLAKVVAKGSAVTTDRAITLTRLGQVMGTPAYMSPEQAAGQEATTSSDVYALGVILYHVLTLTVPFDGPMGAILTGHLMREPEPPRKRAPERGIASALEAICLKAMAKEPKARPANAAELHDRVREWLDGEAERRERVAVAESQLGKAKEKLGTYLSMRADIERLELQCDRVRKAVKPWQPVREKAALLLAHSQLDEAREKLTAHCCEVEATLLEVLGLDADHPATRALLAQYYSHLYEAQTNPELRRLFASLVELYDDSGKHDAVVDSLSGDEAEA